MALTAATAGLVAAGIGAGGSILSGAMASSAASDAADAQIAGQDRALEFQREVYDDQRELAAPYVDAGRNALAALMYDTGLGPQPTFAAPGATATDAQGNPLAIREIQSGGGIAQNDLLQLYGGGGSEADQAMGMDDRIRGLNIGAPTTSYAVGDQSFDTQEAAQDYLSEQNSLAGAAGGAGGEGFTYQGFEASPGYQWRLSEGLSAVDQSAAARGMLNSGATLKAAQRYGQGLASEEYGNQWNRLASIAGLGQAGTSLASSAASQFGAGAANTAAASGDARASAYINGGNAWQNTLGNIAGFAGQAIGGLGGAAAQAAGPYRYANANFAPSTFGGIY